MRVSRWYCVQLLALTIVATAAGCGGGPQKIIPEKAVPVTGTITLDGKPLDNARITYYPSSAAQGDGASGTTDSAGKYELQSVFGSEVVIGAAPGKYKVVISRMVRPDGTPMPADSQEPPIMSGARESIALQYSGFGTSVLSATVATSGGTFDFALKSGGGSGIP
ncbi:MAG UNVERIFIED_CONTAM: carboxypeptidase-like regulatory domain-containing protein [Planctomycetaceae bacterium]|jgi:hypothetical protein